MRLFVAIDPSPAAVAHLDDALRPHIGAGPLLRWSPHEQWHLTLAFLGDVDDGRLPELVERLGRAAHRSPAFTVALAGLGAFPSVRRGRVCWVGVTGDTEPLRLLAARAGAAARRTGIDVSAAPYRPHLTVARPKRPPADLTPLAEALAGYAGPAWPVTELRLVRSHLGAHVRHETVQRWPLRGATGPDGRDDPAYQA